MVRDLDRKGQIESIELDGNTRATVTTKDGEQVKIAFDNETLLRDFLENAIDFDVKFQVNDQGQLVIRKPLGDLVVIDARTGKQDVIPEAAADPKCITPAESDIEVEKKHFVVGERDGKRVPVAGP